jgi:hypothetical protein
MPTLSEIRQQYPQYKDMPDADLAGALHSKFYSDIPRADFDKQIGFSGKVSISDVGAQAWQDVKKFGTNLVGSLKTLPQRAGENAVQYGQTGEYDPAPMMEAAGLATPVNPAVRMGDRAIPGVARAVRGDKPVHTAPQLVAEADKNYSRARTSGVEFNPLIFRDWSTKVARELDDAGRIDAPTSASGTHDLLRRLQNVPATGPGERATQSITNLDAFRQSLNDVAYGGGSVANADRAAAKLIIRKFDEFVPTLGPQDTLGGAAALPYALEQMQKGRGNVAAAKRSNAVSGDLDKAHTGILERAEDRAAAANSGANKGNALRQRFASLLADKEELAGWTPQEIAGAAKIDHGTPGMNISRTTGNLLGGGGGLGAAAYGLTGATAALGSGNPYVAAISALPIAGAGLKALENRLTRRQAQVLDEALRKRSPLYQDTPTTYTPISGEKRAAAMRMLLESQQQQ